MCVHYFVRSPFPKLKCCFPPRERFGIQNRIPNTCRTGPIKHSALYPDDAQRPFNGTSTDISFPSSIKAMNMWSFNSFNVFLWRPLELNRLPYYLFLFFSCFSTTIPFCVQVSFIFREIRFQAFGECNREKNFCHVFICVKNAHWLKYESVCSKINQQVIVSFISNRFMFHTNAKSCPSVLMHEDLSKG